MAEQKEEKLPKITIMTCKEITRNVVRKEV
jgi:hypothetical protein